MPGSAESTRPDHQFSMRFLLGLVTLASAVIAGVVRPNPYITSLLVLTALFVVGSAVLRACFYEGQARAGALGFAIFAGAYFCFVFGPGHSPLRSLWPSTMIIQAAQSAASPKGVNGIPAMPLALSMGMPVDSAQAVTLTQTTALGSGIVYYNVGANPAWNGGVGTVPEDSLAEKCGHVGWLFLMGMLGTVTANRIFQRAKY